MTEQKNTLKEKSGVSPEINSSSTDSRRKFLTKVAIGAPLLTTIASRPVWAGQCTLSGNLSNNVSNQDDTTKCSMWGYSGGAWCNGHANNNGFWALVGLTKDSPLSSLLTSTSFSDDVKIADALNCNCKEKEDEEDASSEQTFDTSTFGFRGGKPEKPDDEDPKKPDDDCYYDYDKLGKDPSEKGLWKQRAVAALNLLLWEYMVEDYDIGNGCSPSKYGDVHADFYFVTTLSVIMDASQSVLENANRDGFPKNDFQNTCT